MEESFKKPVNPAIYEKNYTQHYPKIRNGDDEIIVMHLDINSRIRIENQVIKPHQ
jgi:hypothetical protein